MKWSSDILFLELRTRVGSKESCVHDRDGHATAL